MKNLRCRIGAIILCIIFTISAMSVTAFAKMPVADFLRMSRENKVGTGQYYVFEPNATGVYVFESMGDLDTMITICGADGKTIGQDDNSGQGGNFKLLLELQEGMMYFTNFTVFGSTNATFTMTVIQSDETLGGAAAEGDPVAIQSLQIDDLVLYKGVNSYPAYGEDGNSLGYVAYSYDTLLCGVATLADGTTVRVEEGAFEYQDNDYVLEVQDSQGFTSAWQVGGVYEAIISYGGVSDTCSITIQENPVQSVSVSDVSIHVGKQGYETTDKNGTKYFFYNFDSLVKYKIIFKDGTEKKLGSYGEYQFDNGTYQFLFYDMVEQEEEHWGIGKHSVTAVFCGVKDDFQVEIKEHQYKNTVTKATTSKSGKIVSTCEVCGKQTTKTVYRPKTIELSTTEYTYNGNTKKPTVTVIDSAGKQISTAYYTVSYASGRKYVGKYSVKVTFKGNYSGSLTTSFKIKPPKTSISKVKSAKKAFTVTWQKKTTQTSGYQIKYSTSSTFKSATYKTVSSNRTVSLKRSSLKSNKTYYVRVRTYKWVNGTKYYSHWSDTKTVKTK